MLGVWFMHWEIDKLPGFRLVPLGPMGVRLFFVLSGFLITGILLRVKANIDSGEETIWFASRQFYMRRCLRIFPIYYATLLITGAVIGQMRAAFFWHLTYTSNIFFARHGQLDMMGAHYWTLAVEEQFYLMWPWVVLCIPRKYLWMMMTAIAVVGVGFRIGICLVCQNILAGYVLPFGSLDAFALGGLLALFSSSYEYITARRWLCGMGLIIGLPTAIALQLFFPAGLESRMYLSFFPLATAGVFTWVIGGAAIGFGGLPGSILEWKPMRYLGKISYGLYVYHAFTGWIFFRVVNATHLPLLSWIWLRFLILATITIAVSAASWHFFEKPINNLKRYFDYTPPALRRSKSEAIAG